MVKRAVAAALDATLAKREKETGTRIQRERGGVSKKDLVLSQCRAEQQKQHRHGTLRFEKERGGERGERERDGGRDS